MPQRTHRNLSKLSLRAQSLINERAIEKGESARNDQQFVFTSELQESISRLEGQVNELNQSLRKTRRQRIYTGTKSILYTFFWCVAGIIGGAKYSKANTDLNTYPTDKFLYLCNEDIQKD